MEKKNKKRLPQSISNTINLRKKFESPDRLMFFLSIFWIFFLFQTIFFLYLMLEKHNFIILLIPFFFIVYRLIIWKYSSNLKKYLKTKRIPFLINAVMT